MEPDAPRLVCPVSVPFLSTGSREQKYLKRLPGSRDFEHSFGRTHVCWKACVTFGNGVLENSPFNVVKRSQTERDTYAYFLTPIAAWSRAWISNLFPANVFTTLHLPASTSTSASFVPKKRRFSR